MSRLTEDSHALLLHNLLLQLRVGDGADHLQAQQALRPRDGHLRGGDGGPAVLGVGGGEVRDGEEVPHLALLAGEGPLDVGGRVTLLAGAGEGPSLSSSHSLRSCQAHQLWSD